jgi:hypothetical protein
MGYHSRLRYLIDNQPNAAKYQAWKSKSTAEKQALYATATGQGGPRVPVVRQPGYLIPMTATTTVKVAVKYPILADSPGHPVAISLKSILQPEFQKQSIPAGFEGSEAKGRKKPAILRLTERDATASPRTSRILGTSYKAKKSDSASSGFGKKDETQTALLAETTVETGANTWVGTSANRTFKRIPEIDFVL